MEAARVLCSAAYRAKVALHDEKGPVGGGTHERFVVNDAKFAAKAEAKKG